MIDEVKELKDRLFQTIVWGLIALGVVGVIAAMALDGFTSAWVFRALGIVVLAVVSLILYRVGQYAVAAYVLIFELVGIVIGIFLQSDLLSGIAPYLLIPIIVVAGLLLNPWAIIVTSLLAIFLTLGLVWVTNQWTIDNLLSLSPPFGLTLLIAALMVGSAHYRIRLTDLLSKNRKLLRDRTREMLEAQEKVDQLQQRAVKLQQQVLRTENAASTAQKSTEEKDSKFYGILQGVIQEINDSAYNLEDIIGRVAEAPVTNGRASLLTETWQKIDRLSNLVVNLEALSEIEHDDVTLSYDSVDLGQLIRDMASSARGLLGDKTIIIRDQVPDNLPLIEADPLRVRQILMYLLNNAIKYTNEGTIEIQAELTGDEVTVFVSDTGVGMQREDMALVFEQFGRGRDTQVKAQQGAGLGLTISKKLVELHKGRMWSTSTLGVGSTFYFALPVVAPARTTLSPAPMVEEAATLPSIKPIPTPTTEPNIEPVTKPDIVSVPPTVPVPAVSSTPTKPELEPERSQSKPERTKTGIPAPVFRDSQQMAELRPLIASSGEARQQLSPVARFSTAYITRFGMSLVGFLLIIVGVVALLALLYQPYQSIVDAPVTASTDTLVPEVVAAAETPTPSPVVDVDTATSTTVPVTATDEAAEENVTTIVSEPTATATLPPTQTPTTPPTAIPTEVQVLAVTNTPEPTVTAFVALTETLVPPSPTASPSPSPTTPPTATVQPPTPSPTAISNVSSQAVPAALVEPAEVPSRNISINSSNEGITIRNLDGTETILSGVPTNLDNSRLSWSSNGQVALTSDQTGSRDIFIASAGDGRLINLTNSQSDDHQPDWSPDGEQLAFSSFRGGNFNIFVVDADGQALTQLTQSRGFDEWPAWSPTGQQIAFVSSRDGGDREIYVMDADGSNQTRLTFSGGDDTTPVWSPDGSRILFTSERDGDLDLYVIDATGGMPEQLTNDSADELNPAWAPDGQNIAFTYETETTSDVYTIEAPSEEVSVVAQDAWTQITDTANSEGYPTWVR